MKDLSFIGMQRETDKVMEKKHIHTLRSMFERRGLSLWLFKNSTTVNIKLKLKL